jgi:hypothetical protein
MLDEPPRQNGRVTSHPPAGFANADTPEALLQYPEVQKELNLGKEQIQKIDQIIRRVREEQQQKVDELRDLTPVERRRKQADLATMAMQEIQRRVALVLEANQATRLEQIRRQQQGLHVFADPEVEKALHLTGEQKNRLQMISADAAKEARVLFRTGGQSGFEDTVRKVETIGRNAVEKAATLLTDEQKKIWQKLIGKPFPMRSQSALLRQSARPGAGARPDRNDSAVKDRLTGLGVPK